MHQVQRRSMMVGAALAAAALFATPAARADDLLGLYLGGAVGQAQFDSTLGFYTPQGFKENHTGWKAILGLKPIPLIGAELEYIDFGHPSGTMDAQPADASMKGAAGFAVLTLPIPVVDVYVKGGLARFQNSLNGTAAVYCPAGDGNCGLFQYSRTNTSGAGGTGVGLKLGSVRIRAEYERFNAAGGHPSMVSLGATWTFL